MGVVQGVGSSGGGGGGKKRRNSKPESARPRRLVAAGLGYYRDDGRSSSRSPVVVLPIVPSDDDHTHTQTNKKTKECKPCLLGLAKPYEECCVCVKLGKEMIGNEKEKRKKTSDQPESQWLLWLSNDG
jgi:hypothetical protein